MISSMALVGSVDDTSSLSAGQLRTCSTANDRAPSQKQMPEFLAERARLSGSILLIRIALPTFFAEAKSMIKDFISKLLRRQQSKPSTKGWCDIELTPNRRARNEKLRRSKY